MTIEVVSTPSTAAVIVNGLRIADAPPINDVVRSLGVPTRIDTGPTPAPPGHRNNHIHVFDELGVYVNEHHHTCRAQAIGLALNVDERPYAFTPRTAFNGALLLDGLSVPLRATEAEFLAAAAPWPFEELGHGRWRCRRGGICIFVTAQGPRLSSGRRSRRRSVVDVSLSWPHDPNGPSCGG